MLHFIIHMKSRCWPHYISTNTILHILHVYLSLLISILCLSFLQTKFCLNSPNTHIIPRLLDAICEFPFTFSFSHCSHDNIPQGGGVAPYIHYLVRTCECKTWDFLGVLSYGRRWALRTLQQCNFLTFFIFQIPIGRLSWCLFFFYMSIQ